MNISTPLRAQQLTLGYHHKVVAEQLSLALPSGEFTVIIGPNGCGKSTLLRTLGRLQCPQAGQIWLDGKQIQQYSSKAVARRLGLLVQNTQAPSDITVFELVSRGRYPHQKWLQRWSANDQQAVELAMNATGVAGLADASLETLSGGQRQRAWIAMVLAQQTPLLLLDEPTTWLDISHQIELMELLCRLNQQHHHTLVVVLHDLNQACRYATHLVAMRDGKIVAQGAPADIITTELIEQVYGLKCMIIDDPVAHTPLIVPLGSGR